MLSAWVFWKHQARYPSDHNHHPVLIKILPVKLHTNTINSLNCASLNVFTNFSGLFWFTKPVNNLRLGRIVIHSQLKNLHCQPLVLCFQHSLFIKFKIVDGFVHLLSELGKFCQCALTALVFCVKIGFAVSAAHHILISIPCRSHPCTGRRVHWSRNRNLKLCCSRVTIQQ